MAESRLIDKPACYSHVFTASCAATYPAGSKENDTRQKMAERTLKDELQAIAVADEESLRERFRVLFGYSSEMQCSLLRWRVAYAVQELHGGCSLTASERELLSVVAAKDPAVNPAARELPKPPPRANTTWRREYKGKVYTIRADGNGHYVYEGDGKTYRSPTVVARIITGTHISGRAFFGMK